VGALVTGVLSASCPAPIKEAERVLLGHGSGGALSAELIREVLAPALGTSGPHGVLNDAAIVTVDGLDLALSTDSFVVSPLFFPGGDIGSLSVHGTVNDLAMMGAMPVALSLAYIIEEGFAVDDLRRITESAARAAGSAGVPVVTGDTKVVGRGAADGLFVNTAGIGRRIPGAQIGAERARPGDQLLLSGTIGRHGVTIMSAREGLAFETAVTSDTRPLHRLVRRVIDVAVDLGDPAGVRSLRDPTRGGVASALNELAQAAGVGMEIEEGAVPLAPAVADACDLLGLDPLHVANEGCLVAVIAPGIAERVLEAMRALPEGEDAVRLGEVVAEHPRRVTMRTSLGAQRVVDMLVGEQLPRIC
jgi:hydrogenase expression/formation protein HypE